MGELYNRRSQTAARIETLCEKLKEAENLAAGKACVYATGSFGRCEASQHSDLDLFIVGKHGENGSQLKRLDEICIKAKLIDVTRQLEIPEFSGDGRYLTHYSVHEITTTLGRPEDDVTNTFTARLLLLLESRPLLETTVYQDVTQKVINEYWRDYDDRKSTFMPAFLANDILRLWRTFCVNYEANTERQPDEEKEKRKLKNYKLKHSRLLTCYSGLLYLLAVHQHRKSVTPQDAREMIQLTPTERLEWLLDQDHVISAHSIVKALLAKYELFLETTNAKETDLIERFLDKNKGHEYTKAAYEFGDLVFEALKCIGDGSRFHRLLVV